MWLWKWNYDERVGMFATPKNGVSGTRGVIFAPTYYQRENNDWKVKPIERSDFVTNTCVCFRSRDPFSAIIRDNKEITFVLLSRHNRSRRINRFSSLVRIMSRFSAQNDRSSDRLITPTSSNCNLEVTRGVNLIVRCLAS